MAFIRMLKFGVGYSFRSRRIIIFIVFFIVLSGVTAFSINEIARENRDLLLEQRAVIIQETNLNQNTATEANPIINTYDPDTRTELVITKYFSLPSINMRIFSADLSIPWANAFVQPDGIQQGKYLQSTTNINAEDEEDTWEIIVSEGFIEVESIAGTTLASKISIGTTLNFTDNALTSNQVHLKTVGIFDKPLNAPVNEIWVIISEEGFSSLLLILDNPPPTVFYYRITLISKGFTETLAAAISGDAKATTIANVLSANALVTGDPNWELLNPPKQNTILNQVANTDIILLLGMIGAPIIATMYAFIISRFRTREIAIMKAVGYSNRSVQIMLLTEILTVSILGYLISIFGLQLIFTLNAATLNTTFVPTIWNPLDFSNGIDSMLPSFTAIATFIIVVLSNVLGFIIIFQRSASVKPVELFRAV